MTDEASTTTWQALVGQYRDRAKLDDARIDELRQSTEHWHDTAQMLKRQRDMAEEERDAWKLRAMQSEQQRQALRTECEALRKDAAVVAALQEPSTSVLIAMQSADSHGDVTDAQCIEMLRAAVTAALAVQP